MSRQERIDRIIQRREAVEAKLEEFSGMPMTESVYRRTNRLQSKIDRLHNKEIMLLVEDTSATTDPSLPVVHVSVVQQRPC